MGRGSLLKRYCHPGIAPPIGTDRPSATGRKLVMELARELATLPDVREGKARTTFAAAPSP
jgi:hypothetical protein